ncbi:phosphopentomutase [Luteolibacter arcticus]|uniref:Phosphopentomutase n=1 Tax=Luteolibacter arcticus TaxID=1581411 RepID=A0ABT3GT23_9BACT|nr:phosphopentomutase [Luteolibacter arcticus]MCW1926619.1 phosphopentomutase [Luteolibacter arcticus]
MKRALVIVLDSVGCGGAKDAAAYGDEGADTLGHLFEREGLELPNLAKLGLLDVLGRGEAATLPGAAWAVMSEASAGKDTTTGHWELAGAVLERAFDTFGSFPQDLLGEIGGPFLGNKAASGTEILSELGEEHLRTGQPIVYTSADSVLQLAAHEERYGLEKLWALCQRAREVLDRRGIRIGRVIARPFLGDSAATFKRTANRHDYSLMPPETMLNRLQAAGVETIGVGKISDIFAGSGISESHPTRSNADGMAVIEKIWAEGRGHPHLVFANLVDFDMLYGHRRDPAGYAQCLRDFDGWLGGFLPKVGDDFLLLTADHGNDPYHAGTDHTRERVPLLTVNAPLPLEDSADFTQVARLVERHFA